MFLRDWWQKRQARRSLVRKTCDFVRSDFASTYPGETVAGLQVRAVEPERVVVAVIIHSPLPSRGLRPYRLFAVRNDLSQCEELQRDSGGSAYCFRGIK